MFTKKDLKAVDRKYFNVFGAGCFTVTLQSRNTGHCWHIVLEEYRHFTSCLIYHTHERGTPFHLHGHGRDIQSCLKQIRSHDTYWLSKGSKHSHRSGRSATQSNRPALPG